MIKVMIVDDHEIIHCAVKHLLSEEKDIKVTEGAKDGQEAINKILAVKPDVVLMDIEMPKKSGLQVTKTVLQQDPDIKIIIMTSYPNEILITQVLQEGAMGCLTKDVEKEELVRAIRSAVMGQPYLHSSMTKLILTNVNFKQNKPNKKKSIFELLSPQETEITKRIVQGMKTKDIAQQLKIQPKTVNSVLRSRIFKKLGVDSILHLTLMAIQHGITKID